MLTILKCLDAHVQLAKVYCYDIGLGRWWSPPSWQPRWFAVRERPVNGLDDLADKLGKLASRRDLCVIRGKPLPGVSLDRCQRRYRKEPRAFAPEPRRWLMLDIDGLDDPPGSDMMSDPESCIEHAIAQLPDEFQDVSCYWQGSSSAGIKPGVHAHLWYYLSRPIGDSEARGWLWGAPVDRALFNPIQLHYTADPIFDLGARDPLPRRSGMRDGLEDVVPVPDELPERPPLADAVPVQFEGSIDLPSISDALSRSRAARALWNGERVMNDRSEAHWAFGCALARAGLRDPDSLHAALVAFDEHRGIDLSKIQRRDYAEMTVAKILAVVS